MDSEKNKLEVSSSQKNGGNTCGGEVQEICEVKILEDGCSKTNDKTQFLLTNKTKLNEGSDSKEESQSIFDGDDTQVITEVECAKEIMENNIENDIEILGSNSMKEVAREVKTSGKETKNNGHNRMVDTGETNSEKIESSDKLDETLIIDSDEDVREEENKCDKKSSTDEKEEMKVTQEKSGTKSFGEDSQATTADIADLDDKTPRSPDDLFASQSLYDTTKQNSENSLVDYEDFIPSSLPSQSEKCAAEEVLAETSSVSTPQKRKMEEFDKIYNETKIPRLETPVETSAMEVSSNDKEQSKGDEMANKVSEETKKAGETTSSEQNTQPPVEFISEQNTVSPGESCSEQNTDQPVELCSEQNTDPPVELCSEQNTDPPVELSSEQKTALLIGLTSEQNTVSLEVSCDQLNNSKKTMKDLKDNTSEAKDKCGTSNLLESRKSSESSKDSRKSLEIVFSSFENSSTQDPPSQCTPDLLPHTLPTVPEENGGEYDDELEDMHLHISLSPSQVTQSFSETDISKGDDEVKSIPTRARSNEDNSSSYNCSNSHHDEKSNFAINSHSSDELQKRIPDTVTVHDNSDVQITSPEEKVSIANDVIILQTVENGSFVKPNTDSDVTVLLDKREESGNSYLGLAKHKDMNGTMLKRKHPETEEEVEKLDVVGEANRATSDVDTRKRSRLTNLSSEGRSTPDLPLLLPTKDSSLPLRDVECTIALKCQLRIQVNEDLRQIHCIEILQCQDVEDLLLTGTVNPRESSGGSAADESKNSSPSSVMSLGPFPLKALSCRLSSSSTSTTSSGHSIIGIKSKSADWHFTAPMKLPPSRINRTRNVQLSSEFSSDLIELLEKRLFIDETEPKVLCSSSNTTAPLVSSALPEAVDVIKDAPQNTSETEAHVLETPKSIKKLPRGSRSTRSTGRNLVSKMKGIKEEENASQPTPERETQVSGESSSSQRKPRKTPSRSSKRNTPTTLGSSEEPKVSTTPSIGPSSGRSRRNRNEQNQNEKVERNESSSHESSHVYEWDPEGCFTKLVIGAPVFARWTDKKYYPGKIKEKLKDGRWVIEFDDKTVRPLKEEFVIAVNILTKGQIVFAYDEEDSEQGIIVEFKLKEGEVQYGVDLDSGRKLFVPRSRIFMSEDQARLLQENMDPKSPTTSSPALTTVSCDNIVHHKRPRATRVLFGNASPSVSGVAKTAKRPSYDTSCSSLALPVGSSSSVSDSNDKGSTLILDEVGGVDPEVPSSFPESLHTPSGRGKGPGRIKSKTRTPRRNVSANHSVTDMQEYNTLHEVLGPIPAKGSKMFSGKCFLLTHSGGRSVDCTKTTTSSKSNKKSEQTSSSEYEGVPTDDDIISTIPFVKEHLRRQLETGEGIVFENFEDVPEDQYQNCFLVADRPSLTAKYILCVANGIKIINHRWVIEEVKGSGYSWMTARLQTGWDLEGQRFVPPDATVRTRKQKPLNKKEVGIVNESQTFIKFWERILELLGANVRHISPGSPEQDRQFSGVDVILTDGTCPPEVQDRAREWSIPLVSTVWVTQSLITWKIRPFSGHPHYRYDYCTSE